MNGPSPTTFSLLQRWSMAFSLAVASLAVLALVAMTNYLAARHYQRINFSETAQMRLSPLTQRVLGSISNDVQVTVYFNRDEPLYDLTWGLLKEYHFANPRIKIETVDYQRQPGPASLVKAKYNLTDKDLIVFDCAGNRKVVYQSELSNLDLQPLISGRSREVRRTHFKGEQLFTSAILSVVTPRKLKAYYLEGHGEHPPESDDELMGYSRFSGVLKENNVQVEVLRWAAGADIPPDCQLLIIAGPRQRLLQEELERIERYLKQGGRLFVLFNYLSVGRPTGLEKLLANWGVEVGQNVVVEQKRYTRSGQDMVVTSFGTHPLIKAFLKSSLYLVLPRKIAKVEGAGGADAPRVEVLAATSDGARVITDIRPGPAFQPGPNDEKGVVPLAVAVEKGNIPGVTADRGATRLVVIGESIFLGNRAIEETANHEFAAHAINWLLAREQLLPGLAPRPIKEYRLVMTRAQVAAVNWILLAGMPGAVLLAGLLVWMRRRR